MNKRWMLALTAAVGIGLLTVPLLMKPKPAPEAAVECRAAVAHLGERSLLQGEPAPSSSFTLKDMNGATSGWPTTRARSCCSTSGRRGAARAKSRSPSSSSCTPQYKDRGFVILGVLSRRHTDEGPAPARSWTSTRWTIRSCTRARARVGVRIELWALPTSFLIGRDGAVCAKQLGPASKEDVERSLKALL